MKIDRLYIQSACRETLGYSEAENKNSFETGVGVAISKIEERYSSVHDALTKERDSYREMYEDLKKQVITVSDIFNQFNEY